VRTRAVSSNCRRFRNEQPNQRVRGSAGQRRREDRRSFLIRPGVSGIALLLGRAAPGCGSVRAMGGAMPRTNLWSQSVPRVELAQGRATPASGSKQIAS
jgi:hypothetical protein